MKNDQNVEPGGVSKQAEAVEAAVRRAVRRALLDHKRTGDPVVFCEDGIVRWIPPDQIPLADEPTNSD